MLSLHSISSHSTKSNKILNLRVVLHVPIRVLTRLPTLVMTLLLTPFVIQIINIKNILNYVTLLIIILISTLILCLRLETGLIF